MYHIDFTKPIHVHFIGIGGISMSGLAELLHTKGFIVSGSDSKDSKIVDRLRHLGITIHIGQKADNITEDINLVVYTAAVKSDNVEYLAAQKHNIPMLDRAEFLGQVMLQYKNAIGISGTHGKTTTTSMVSLMMLESNFDPTISVGGILDNIEGNIRIGNSENFIVESCEYKNSFLSFNPSHAIILNIEEEHLDYFKDIEDIRNSFHIFAKKLPDYGNLVIWGGIDRYEELTKDLSCHVITYGMFSSEEERCENINRYDYAACNVSSDDFGLRSYDLYKYGKFVDRIRLGVIGDHNVLNSLAAISLVDTLGGSMSAIKTALLAYKGTERRFERKGVLNGITIVDDYAHHPSEIKATLTAAASYPHIDIWCVFQPHTYTRTKSFFHDFTTSLALADKIVLADIYAAREENPGDISSRDIQNELLKIGKEAYYFKDFKEIEKFLLEHCTNGDLLITMGAGDVVSIGESLLQK